MNNVKVSENFKLREFEDKRTGLVKIDESLIEVLQEIRTKIGKPIKITSAYRTKESHVLIYKKIYGDRWEDHYVENSQHLLGKAVDFTILGATYMDYMEALKIIESYEVITGIGDGIKSGKFIHMDTKDVTRRRKWRY